MAGLASGTGNKAAPPNKRKDDLYESPPEAVTRSQNDANDPERHRFSL
jgi:hypothetical protein